MTDNTTAIPQVDLSQTQVIPEVQPVQPTAPKGQRVELSAGWYSDKGLNLSNNVGTTMAECFRALMNGNTTFYSTVFTNSHKTEGSKQPDAHNVAFINKENGS